jgi:hypothetical protein
MPDMKELGKLWGIDCYSKFVEENGRVGRIMIDGNGDTLTKSTKSFDSVDLCQGDLTNAFTKLQKLSKDHMMGELEY